MSKEKRRRRKDKIISISILILAFYPKNKEKNKTIPRSWTKSQRKNFIIKKDLTCVTFFLYSGISVQIFFVYLKWREILLKLKHTTVESVYFETLKK